MNVSAPCLWLLKPNVFVSVSGEKIYCCFKCDLNFFNRYNYVSMGCDYNPFFAGIGKGSFLRAFYMYAEFISADGSLSDLSNDEGYLVFF